MKRFKFVGKDFPTITNSLSMSRPLGHNSCLLFLNNMDGVTMETDANVRQSSIKLGKERRRSHVHRRQ